ncbi:MAG TPA: 16S rRNA (cytidine(1402)-2'-O)-methyltransferase [Actinomycetota bacterium]|nr:16S rRNA (cytidine(1402)-2'-O)-methyltransferase [Actinomycetota bacterium]
MAEDSVAIIDGVAGTLFLVGTPIGNLEDLTERARRVLGSVDLIAAEDTRRTGRLLQHLGIKATMVSFFEGNEQKRMPELIEALREGSMVAVVSDAGMPALSDPGYRLVAACVEVGIPVDVAPGPSAAVAALVISGLPTDRFVFEGFLPRSGRRRAERLDSLALEPRTILLFESPRRVAALLEDLLKSLGDRRVALVRELTKQHQEVLRGGLNEILDEAKTRELRGEVVLVVEGSSEETAGGDESEAVAMAAEMVARGERKREAARRAGRLTGVPANRIYARLASSRSTRSTD